MSKTTFTIDQEDFDRLAAAMDTYGPGSADRVSEVVQDSGDYIRDRIDPLIHASGRTFKGHRSGVKGTDWALYTTGEPLTIVVRARPTRRYLYFPDDGSNTKRHYGGQQFMYRGAQAAAPGILSRAVDALLEEFERS